MKSLLLLFLIFYCSLVFSQMKIGDNPININTNSILEIESPNQGVLMPRVGLVAINNPAPLTEHIAGMTLYNTTEANGLVPGFYYNDGVKWVKFSQALTTINGLTTTNDDEVKLGGTLNEPTTIETSQANTLAISGLQAGDVSSDEVVTIDPNTGVLKKTPISSLIIEEQMIHIANEGDTQFSTPFPYTTINKINVYRNGARIGATMVNGTTIQLEVGVECVEGDEIRIVQTN